MCARLAMQLLTEQIAAHWFPSARARAGEPGEPAAWDSSSWVTLLPSSSPRSDLQPCCHWAIAPCQQSAQVEVGTRASRAAELHCSELEFPSCPL